MVTYVSWLKASYPIVSPLFKDEVGEALSDANFDEVYGMTGSANITAENIANLAADPIAGPLLTFSNEPPAGWGANDA